MDASYWNLFWKTGMPEAWLMGRDTGAVPPPDVEQGAARGLDGQLTAPTAAPVSGIPGNPRNLY